MFRFVLALLAGLIPALVQGQDQGQEILVTNGEWLPFLSQHKKHFGVVSHIVSDVFAKQGIDVKYEFYPWARAYNMVAKKRAVASVIWTVNEQRATQVQFSQPLMTLEDVFYFRRENLTAWKKVTDFSDRRIGITKGYYYGNEFADAQEKGLLKTSTASTDVANFKMLLAGRIDVFPIVRVSAEAVLKRHFSAEQRQQLAYHPKAVRTVSYHVIFNQTEQGNQMLKLFNAGLKEMKESGAYQTYWQKYQAGYY